MTSANNSFTNWYIQNIIHNLVYFTNNNVIKSKSKQKLDVFYYHYLLFIDGIDKNKFISGHINRFNLAIK